LLDRKLKLFILVKDETKATAHAMPDEVVAFTEELDNPLREILYSAHHERQVFAVTKDSTSKAFPAMKDSNVILELSCHPNEGIFDFDGKPGTQGDLSKDLNRLIEGGPDSIGDREKW